MADLDKELIARIAQQHNEAQSKYTYFLLAAAASCIALAVQRTTSQSLGWNQVPLGLAVLCWGASFWSGCKNRVFFSTTLYANIAFLQLKDGSHPNQPSDPAMVDAAKKGVSEAAEQNSSSANRWGKMQFRWLIVGALFFLCWHIIEMATKSPL